MPNDLFSWLWWIFTTIVVAIIVNITSEFIKSKVNNVIGNYSKKQKNKNLEQERKIKSIVDRMIENPSYLSHFHFRATALQVDFYSYLIIVFMLTLSLIFLIPFGRDTFIEFRWELIFENYYFMIVVSLFVFLVGMGARLVMIYRNFTYAGRIIDSYEDVLYKEDLLYSPS